MANPANIPVTSTGNPWGNTGVIPEEAKPRIEDMIINLERDREILAMLAEDYKVVVTKQAIGSYRRKAHVIEAQEATIARLTGNRLGTVESRLREYFRLYRALESELAANDHVDPVITREMRDLLKQVAIELRQWQTKTDITSGNKPIALNLSALTGDELDQLAALRAKIDAAANAPDAGGDPG